MNANIVSTPDSTDKQMDTANKSCAVCHCDNWIYAMHWALTAIQLADDTQWSTLRELQKPWPVSAGKNVNGQHRLQLPAAWGECCSVEVRLRPAACNGEANGDASWTTCIDAVVGLAPTTSCWRTKMRSLQQLQLVSFTTWTADVHMFNDLADVYFDECRSWTRCNERETVKPPRFNLFRQLTYIVLLRIHQYSMNIHELHVS